jgi:hypothetical protein
MIKIGERVGRFLCLAGSLSIASVLIVGCAFIPESTFELAKDSRLPKWISLPPGVTRDDVSLTMDYYSVLWGYDTEFILKDANGKRLAKMVGNVRCSTPIQLYPVYRTITVNGTTDIIEHKEKGPIFEVTDDSAARKQIVATGCS